MIPARSRLPSTQTPWSRRSVLARAARSHNSGCGRCDQRDRDGAEPGIGVEHQDVPTILGGCCLQPSPRRVGRLGPEHAQPPRRSGRRGGRVPPGAPRRLWGGPPPSTGAPTIQRVNRSPSIVPIGGGCCGDGSPATNDDRKGQGRRRDQQSAQVHLGSVRPGGLAPARRVTLARPGTIPGTPAVFPTGEGARAKPVGIRRCPATVMPQTWGRARSPATGGP